MNVVWSSTVALTVREIAATLPGTERLAYTTVQTVTDRLHVKGWLARERAGKAYVYSASHTADEYTAGLMEEALGTSQDRSAALARFAGQLSAQEAGALRQALAEQNSDAGR